MVQDMFSALFGVDGLQVIEADAEPDGSVTVWAVTGPVPADGTAARDGGRGGRRAGLHGG